MTFYDANGTPSPTGRYEIVNGSLRLRKSYVLQHGESVRYDIMAMDAAPPSGHSVYITDTKPDTKAIRDSALASRFSGNDPVSGRPLAALAALDAQTPASAPAAPVATVDTAAISAAARANRYA